MDNKEYIKELEKILIDFKAKREDVYKTLSGAEEAKKEIERTIIDTQNLISEINLDIYRTEVAIAKLKGEEK